MTDHFRAEVRAELLTYTLPGTGTINCTCIGDPYASLIVEAFPRSSAPQPDTVTIILQLLGEYLAGAPAELSHDDATQWEIGRRHQLRRELAYALATRDK